MGTPTLDDADRTVLERLADGPRTAAELDDLGDEPAERLDALAESGLVIGSEDGYELTDSGRRVIEAPGDASADDRIDMPDGVEAALEQADPAPDRAAALRGAFAFLSYWGEATPYEIRDAVYSEQPAGYDSSKAWWEGFVREELAALPGIEPGEEAWRYTGRPGVEDPSVDGRHGPDDDAPYGDAKHALESLDLDRDERAAVHAAFALLADDGEADEERIAALHDDHPAGFGSAEEWYDRIGALLAELPGVEREDGTWRYQGDEAARDATGSHGSETTEPMDEKGSGAGSDRLPGSEDAKSGSEERDGNGSGS